jgi:transcriptional regulator with XRE-family HTH domain
MGSSETAPARDGRPPSPVRNARKALGLRLIDVAGEADIAVGYMSMIENGYVPAEPLRRRIAAVLGTKPAKLWPGVAG